MIWTFRRALLAAAALRLVLLFWGFHQDKSRFKYTDIDYFVFSDAARCLLSPQHPGCSLSQGFLSGTHIGDPYARRTYRYTPLLAILATPNSMLHSAFAKILFCLADLANGVILNDIMHYRGYRATTSILYISIFWLLNPMIANISTRGSAEAILGLLVLSTLALAEKKRWTRAALCFGAAVHFKLFPIIYATALMSAITVAEKRLISMTLVYFGLVSFTAFMALNLAMYSIWGNPFIEHTFLYHLSRLDHRHNFSAYFYPYYLAAFSPSTQFPMGVLRHPLSAFVPQGGLSLGLGWLYGGDDLAFAWFLQTFVFVTFNKVCTSQYFLWYIWLLPPILPKLALSRGTSATILSSWVLGQVVWLWQAYQLEMLGKPTHRALWGAGILFQLVNCGIAGKLISSFPMRKKTA